MNDNEEKPKDLEYKPSKRMRWGFATYRIGSLLDENLPALLGWIGGWLAFVIVGLLLVALLLQKSPWGLPAVLTIIVSAMLTLPIAIWRARNKPRAGGHTEMFTLIRRENGQNKVIDRIDSNIPLHMRIVYRTLDEYFDEQLALGMTMVMLVKRNGSEAEVPFDGQWADVCEFIMTSKDVGETPRKNPEK